MMIRGAKFALPAFLLMIGFAGQSALAKGIDGAVMIAGQPMRGAR